jgi:ubiquinone/menaquinone biosynthesis C-methylase UbiE
MKKIKPRVPEGGAIEDSNEMSMEQYSTTMRKKLGSHYKKYALHVKNVINPSQNAKVLEIGPGPGWAGIFLLKERDDIFLDAIEASPDMIRVAANNAKDEGVADRVNYMQAVVENMQKISDNKYDLVISRESLHHWDDPLKGFKEISRVLKQDGKIYIEDHRRDIGFFAKCIVNIIGPLMAGKMAKYWKSSINAGYTPKEIEKMIGSISRKNWIVKADILTLSISST